ncbi:DUF1643 domain-containing protein [Cyanobium gracile]|uniref:DUF1643 domain-containing protein n=1 Tax=Cyanobium gracile (strain ATCC 27147 / PCC 6307) TaxID=292564 RepID=K9P4F7_CYAGP|nr:DUF1643 domain-containing protein [Cyanobium gracile]AFY28297.1 hypothetical protein Cyagr_1118 [Cyanobium gracile PCC 6307]
MKATGRAAFSRCGHYRWWLERVWEPQGSRLLFIGLNPSRADHRHDDPTLRRLVAFAAGWGYGGLEVLNLFARISPRPSALALAADPVGAANPSWIRRRVRAAQRPRGPAGAAAPLPLIWLGWGNGGRRSGQDERVLELLAPHRHRLVCLGLTASGAPLHPLYRPAASLLRPYGASCGQSDAAVRAPWPAPPAATPSTCS